MLSNAFPHDSVFGMIRNTVNSGAKDLMFRFDILFLWEFGDIYHSIGTFTFFKTLILTGPNNPDAGKGSNPISCGILDAKEGGLLP